MLGDFADLEANMAHARTREGLAARQRSEEYDHGRPPLGFRKEDCRLAENGNSHDVGSVLGMKQKGETGTHEAARQLGGATATINRALERADLSGLEPTDRPRSIADRQLRAERGHLRTLRSYLATRAREALFPSDRLY